MQELMKILEQFRIFLNKLEQKIAGFIVFLIIANICIFLYECNQGQMVEKEPFDKEFLVQKIEYGKTQNTIHVREVVPENPNSLYPTYLVKVNISKTQLTKLKVKKGRILVINTTIGENDLGKKTINLNKIKFNKKFVYTLQNE